jgi:flagella basal body P-ring formation protein FlgA
MFGLPSFPARVPASAGRSGIAIVPIEGLVATLLAALSAVSVNAQAPNASASYGVERTIPVAARALPRGASLSSSDYRVAAVMVRSALATAVAAESGWVTRRPVAAGEPLVEPAVGPPALVASGQPVMFVADAGAVHLAVRGTAATSGALGDRVWVRMDSGRRLRGTVTAPGTIRADTTSHR